MKRWLPLLGFLIVLFLANLLLFTGVRSLISTYQGFRENAFLLQDGIFISNIDPEKNDQVDYDQIDLDQTRKVYDYLEDHTHYGIEMFGYTTDLANQDEMDVLVNYVNQLGFQLRPLPIAEGESLNFEDGNPKGVLVGAGLAQDYPIGCHFDFDNPVTGQTEEVFTVGILETNAYRSNLYALNSKNYFNYTVFYPLTPNFIQSSTKDLQVNALNDLILTQSSREEADQVKDLIKATTGLSYNFFSQARNTAYFQDYYGQSIAFVMGLTLLAMILAVFLAVWINLVSIRLAIRDMTLHMLVGLTYHRLRLILYQFYGILLAIVMLVLTLFTSYNRYTTIFRKDAIFASLGFLRLVDIDWAALGIVLLVNLLCLPVIVEIMMAKIKRKPISLGVFEWHG